MWECEWWRLYKITTKVELHIRENFLYRLLLGKHQLLKRMKKRNLFSYVQCDIEVPENLRAKFPTFHPIFRNTLFSKNDIGDSMKTYAEDEGIMSQPRKMLISSSTLQNGTLITPLLLFYLQLGLVVTNIRRLVLSTLQRNAQQLCIGSSGRKRERWRKSKFKWNNEASSQQLLRLPDHRPEPTHCNEVPHWRKNKCDH